MMMGTENQIGKETKRKLDFYNNFNSRFMPCEHMGLKPEAFTMNFSDPANEKDPDFQPYPLVKTLSPVYGSELQNLEYLAARDGYGQPQSASIS